MANTVKRDQHELELSEIDSDWDFSDTYTDKVWQRGINVHSIRFNPVATDDKCVIFSSSAVTSSAAAIFYATGADVYDDRVQYYYGKKMKLFLDYSAGSYSSANTSVTIMVETNPSRR